MARVAGNRCLVRNTINNDEVIIPITAVFIKNQHGILIEACAEDVSTHELYMKSTSGEAIRVNMIVYGGTRNMLMAVKSSTGSKRRRIQKRLSLSPLADKRKRSQAANENQTVKERKLLQQAVAESARLADAAIVQKMIETTQETLPATTTIENEIVHTTPRTNLQVTSLGENPSGSLAQLSTPEVSGQIHPRSPSIPETIITSPTRRRRSEPKSGSRSDSSPVRDTPPSPPHQSSSQTHTGRISLESNDDDTVEGTGVLNRDELREDLMILKKAIVNSIKTFVVGKKNLKAPDRDGKVEILDGVIVDVGHLMKAAEAKRMRLRANHIMRAYWPADVLCTLSMKKEKNRPDRRTVTSKELQELAVICMELQTTKELQCTQQHNPNMHMRQWVRQVLKNARRRATSQDGADDEGGYDGNESGGDENEGGCDENEGGCDENEGGCDENKGGVDENEGGCDENRAS